MTEGPRPPDQRLTAIEPLWWLMGGTAGRGPGWRLMLVEPLCVFSFKEPDHLTRIHLKLALEDVGFAVSEEADVIALCDDTARPERAAPAPLAGKDHPANR